MPSAITCGEAPGQLRQGLLLAPRALHPNTTHRFDLLTVQLTAIRDHGVDGVPQAGSLHVGVLDKHKVLQESAEPAGGRNSPSSLGPLPAEDLRRSVPCPRAVPRSLVR